MIVGNWMLMLSCCMLLPPGSAIDGLVFKNTSRSINCCCCWRARSSPWCTAQQFDRLIKNDAAAADQWIVEWRATWCARRSYVHRCCCSSCWRTDSGLMYRTSLFPLAVVRRIVSAQDSSSIDLDQHQSSVDRLRQDVSIPMCTRILLSYFRQQQQQQQE